MCRPSGRWSKNAAGKPHSQRPPSACGTIMILHNPQASYESSTTQRDLVASERTSWIMGICNRSPPTQGSCLQHHGSQYPRIPHHLASPQKVPFGRNVINGHQRTDNSNTAKNERNSIGSSIHRATTSRHISTGPIGEVTITVPPISQLWPIRSGILIHATKCQ